MENDIHGQITIFFPQIEGGDNQEITMLILSCVRLDVDITELHSWITRSEAVLQSPEFAIYRKEGNFLDLKEKVNVCHTLIFMCFSYVLLLVKSLLNSL